MTLLLLSKKRFQPRSIPNLQLWLDATRINQADNTAVASWADQSGNAYNAEQSGTAARPTYRTNQLNGLPAVVFDGTDDVLTIPSSTATFKFLHSDVSTVFMVMRAGSVADPNALYLVFGNGGANAANIGYEIWWDDRASISSNNAISNRIYRGVSGSNTAGQITQNIFVANTFGIMTVVGDPANATALERFALIVNGGNTNKSNTLTNALSNSNAFSDLTIGNVSPSGSLYLNGAISEIIVYNRALNTSELAQVHRYLSRKWGIALA